MSTTTFSPVIPKALFQERVTHSNTLFYTMGNQKNSRKRKPTAKKLAEDKDNSDSPPPSHRPSTRPKPRPTGKAAIKDPKPSHAEALGREAAHTSKKVCRSVTWADSDTSMISCDAGQGEEIEVEDEEEEDGPWDDLHEDDEEVEDVTEVKQRKATAPLAGM